MHKKLGVAGVTDFFLMTPSGTNLRNIKRFLKLFEKTYSFKLSDYSLAQNTQNEYVSIMHPPHKHWRVKIMSSIRSTSFSCTISASKINLSSCDMCTKYGIGTRIDSANSANDQLELEFIDKPCRWSPLASKNTAPVLSAVGFGDSSEPKSAWCRDKSRMTDGMNNTGSSRKSTWTREDMSGYAQM